MPVRWSRCGLPKLSRIGLRYIVGGADGVILAWKIETREADDEVVFLVARVRDARSRVR